MNSTTLANANFHQDLDGLIIPGGWCPDYLRRDRRFVHLVAEVAKSGLETL